MFWAPPSEEQMAATRKSAADYPEPEFLIWDENFEQFVWFRSMLSQMRYSEGRATGLDYNVAYRDFYDMGLSGDALDEWKWKMKVMESATVAKLNAPA